MVTKVKKRSNSLFSENATSGHCDITNFCRIINTDIRDCPSKISDQHVQEWLFYRSVLKIPVF